MKLKPDTLMMFIQSILLKMQRLLVKWHLKYHTSLEYTIRLGNFPSHAGYNHNYRNML